MDGVEWEMKAPKAAGVKAFDRILKRAVRQSRSIVIDAARIDGSTDAQIERGLHRVAPLVRDIRRLFLVKKNREVVDINR